MMRVMMLAFALVCVSLVVCAEKSGQADSRKAAIEAIRHPKGAIRPADYTGREDRPAFLPKLAAVLGRSLGDAPPDGVPFKRREGITSVQEVRLKNPIGVFTDATYVYLCERLVGGNLTATLEEGCSRESAERALGDARKDMSVRLGVTIEKGPSGIFKHAGVVFGFSLDYRPGKKPTITFHVNDFIGSAEIVQAIRDGKID